MSEQTTQIATVFDSDEQQVGQVYAKALLNAALQAGKLDSVVDEFESFVTDVLNKNRMFELSMLNPKLNIDDKFKLLDKVFASKMDAVLLKFLKVVCRRARFSAIRSIQLSASKQRDELAGRILVHVTVPNALDQNALSNLTQKLKSVFNKEIRLVTKVNPEILGGLVVRVGDTVYDGSVDGQLRSLRKVVGIRAETALRSASDLLVQGS